MLQYIAPAIGLLFALENILWINISMFIGSVFAAIPGMGVILCVILFLSVTYSTTTIHIGSATAGILCGSGIKPFSFFCVIGQLHAVNARR